MGGVKGGVGKRRLNLGGWGYYLFSLHFRWMRPSLSCHCSDLMADISPLLGFLQKSSRAVGTKPGPCAALFSLPPLCFDFLLAHSPSPRGELWGLLHPVFYLAGWLYQWLRLRRRDPKRVAQAKRLALRFLRFISSYPLPLLSPFILLQALLQALGEAMALLRPPFPRTTARRSPTPSPCGGSGWGPWPSRPPVRGWPRAGPSPRSYRTPRTAQRVLW